MALTWMDAIVAAVARASLSMMIVGDECLDGDDRAWGFYGEGRCN